MNIKPLRTLPLGALFMVRNEDLERYGHKVGDQNRTFMLIEHRHGFTNCVDTRGIFGPFIDPDRSIIEVRVSM